jgi:hypothetical protein
MSPPVSESKKGVANAPMIATTTAHSCVEYTPSKEQ